MFCKECGNEMSDNASICVKCGVATKNMEVQSKSRAVYIVLALFLGLLGIHNFYAGYHVRGGIQLAICLFLGWLLVPLAVLGLWLLIEIFVITEDAQGNRLT